MTNYQLRPVSAKGEFLSTDNGNDTPDCATVEGASLAVKFLRGMAKIPGIARTKAFRYDFNGDRGYYRTTARYWAVNQEGHAWLELWTMNGEYLGQVPPKAHGTTYVYGDINAFVKGL